MALAFKREQKTLEEGGLKDCISNIVSYTGLNIPVEVDYDSIKQIPGESVWSNSQKEGSNLIALRYINDQMKYVYLTISEIAKDDVGKEALTKVVKKVRLNVTANGKPGIDMRDPSTFTVSVQDGTLLITANLDFTQYVGQSYPYTEIARIVEQQIEGNTNVLFNRAKAEFMNGNFASYYSRLTSSLGRELPVEFDWSEALALKGTYEASSGRPEPRSAVTCRYLNDNGWYGVVSALETVCKDDLGKEAFFETYNQFVIHPTGNVPKGTVYTSEIKAHRFEKKGKEGHVWIGIPFDSKEYALQTFPDRELAEMIEKSL